MSQVGRIRLSTGGEMIPAGTFPEVMPPVGVEPFLPKGEGLQIEEPQEIVEPTSPVVGDVAETIIHDEGFKDIIARLAASRARLDEINGELASMAGLPVQDVPVELHPPEGMA